MNGIIASGMSHIGVPNQLRHLMLLTALMIAVHRVREVKQMSVVKMLSGLEEPPALQPDEARGEATAHEGQEKD